MSKSSTTSLTVLVVGATGSIGCRVVEEALARGHQVRALVRDRQKAHFLPNEALRVVGDLTVPSTLVEPLQGVNAVVFTHGSEGGKRAAELVDYGAVRHVLHALQGRRVRVALMTSIGVTNRTGAYNRSTQVHDWKRRGERLLRASGLPYTIVRPGWFDYNAPGQHRLVFLQGDTRRAGDPSDGVVSRQQIAQVLVQSLTSDAATFKTFELVSAHGAGQEDLEPLFAALKPDSPRALDAVLDEPNMPLEAEPDHVRSEYAQWVRS